MNEINHRKAPPPHGDARRYRYWSCRCEPCREAGRIYYKRLREGRLASAFTDPAGSIRRVRGLVVHGYGYADLGDALGVAPKWPGWIAGGQVGPRGLLVRTAAQITNLCDQLMRQPAPTGRRAAYARTVGARNGWFPIAAWDDIDDPDAVPNLGGDGADIVDDVAIEAVLERRLRFTTLNERERVTLFRRVDDWPYKQIMATLGVSASVVLKWRTLARHGQQAAA